MFIYSGRNGLSSWVSHPYGSSAFPGSCLLSSSAPEVVGIWGVKQQMRFCSLSISQIKEKKVFKKICAQGLCANISYGCQFVQQVLYFPHPISCLWPANATEDGPSTWAPGPICEIQKEAPGSWLQITQLQLLWPSGTCISGWKIFISPNCKSFKQK